MCDIDHYFKNALLFAEYQTRDKAAQARIVTDKMLWMVDVHVSTIRANPALMDHHDRQHGHEGSGDRYDGLLSSYTEAVHALVERRFASAIQTIS